MTSSPFGLSGFAPVRFDSLPQTSEAEYAQQAAARQQEYGRKIAAVPEVMTPDAYAASLMQAPTQNYLGMFQSAGIDLGPNAQSLVQNALQRDFQTGTLDQAYAAVGGKDNWDAWNRYYNGGAAQAQAAYGGQVSGLYDKAYAQMDADAKAAAARQQNQQLQQQAYSQQTGSGFTGGLLNDSYGNAFGNVLGANASGFSGGMMSQPTSNLGMGSGSAVAPSTGLNPWMPPAAPNNGMATPLSQPMQAPPQAPNNGNAAGWGGPFSAKNPWSLG